PLPHLRAQFLLGDHAVAMLKKIAEHLEDLRRQPGRLARSLQGIELGVQGTIGKAVDHTFSAAHWRIAITMFASNWPCERVEETADTGPRAWQVFLQQMYRNGQHNVQGKLR